MNVFERIATRTQVLSGLLNRAKTQARQYKDQLNVLAVYAALQETGLSFGDRFRVRGKAFGQTYPEGIVTGHESGVLTSLIIGKDGSLTKNSFAFHKYRLNDIVPLGSDPLGLPYLNQNFDPSDLLNDEEDNVGHL